MRRDACLISPSNMFSSRLLEFFFGGRVSVCMFYLFDVDVEHSTLIRHMGSRDDI